MAATGTYRPITFEPFSTEYCPINFDMKINISEAMLAFDSSLLQKSKMAAIHTYYIIEPLL